MVHDCISADTSTDLTNNFYEEQRQIHGGMMDRFVLYDTAAKGLTMGYWGLEPLGTRDRVAADLTNAFDFTQP